MANRQHQLHSLYSLVKGLNVRELADIESLARKERLWVEKLNARDRGKLNKHCRLLCLPSELRNRIYYFVALNSLPAHIKTGEPPALLLVSRQVRAEFDGLYFSDVIMNVQRLDSTSPEAPHWSQVTSVPLLKALLGVYPPEQNVSFRRCFGKDHVVRHTAVPDCPSTGDEEQWYKNEVQRYARNHEGYMGLIRFPLEAEMAPRYIWQSVNDDPRHATSDYDQEANYDWDVLEEYPMVAWKGRSADTAENVRA